MSGENKHICGPDCTHESHQFPDAPITNERELKRYESQIKDLGLVMTRRSFMKYSVGLGATILASGGLMSFLAGCASQPAGNAQNSGSMVKADVEKPDLTIGFIPITCATPIIMADPIGFYEKHGLNVTVKKYGGWADIRDAYIAGEVDAAHLLSPMTLSLSLGLGSAQVPTRLSAIENVNGQAITLANKYKDTVKSAADFKGMVLGVPFDYSMHNLLLRYYLADSGLDPDKDVEIRVVRPPDMVAQLVTGNIDGYLAPDPFNQRAVHENAGYIFKLTKDIWPSHPCCAFGVKQEFIDKYPQTYHALLKSIVDATNYSSDSANREEIAKAISTREYLNQPEEVVKSVLTGQFANGLGATMDVPDRINFDPFPWKSFAVWMLIEMQRWGYLKNQTDLDFPKIADEVFRTDDVRKAQQELGFSSPADDYKIEKILGKDFDASKVTQMLVQ
ncbi:CmpA/NrtA family ABC transporter substrate-binding protein [Paenibacillus abyssi]|uniref:Nitrate ABC transporter substrate-binding protein n=1 Tax=Paenibacillus abyssi TaxID=1340531 RepID=A0A917LF36_9BACL|nr:CmpA/NrtA family ABC transporter substrate-binding protein [Paenibacillus abyssi]GGG16965.1 nitrate ABC transporter substrate-binding protein [Paenibacillus abyssi]